MDASEGKKFSLASSHATVLEIVSNHVRVNVRIESRSSRAGWPPLSNLGKMIGYKPFLRE